MVDPTSPPPAMADASGAGGDPRLELLELAWDLSAHLSWLRELGVGELPCSPPAIRPPSKASPIPTRAPAPSKSAVVAAPRAPTITAAEPTPLLASDLSQLLEEAKACARCSLSKSRVGVALGNGVARAELMFVGERPAVSGDGAVQLFDDEVAALLDKMIRAMGFEPAQVACANVIQCASRDEPPFETPAACRALVWTQIALIEPKVIVALGKVAAQALLQVSTPITRLRGEWQDCAGIRLMPTFHPAYLLKHPDAKRQAWNDLREVARALKR
ncbi:MAG: uracil-DNA glycosylase [Myxococcales bacterium]|jgi:DNA polymerase|nr:uracil-DNA glycosylase [Myxococcales bacterium]